MHVMSDVRRARVAGGLHARFQRGRHDGSIAGRFPGFGLAFGYGHVAALVVCRRVGGERQGDEKGRSEGREGGVGW